MFILYDLIFLIYCLIYIPIMISKGKWHDGFGERFAFIPEIMREKLRDKKNLWIHAVSVGEVLAISGVIQQLRTEYPRHQIVLTVTTKTGHTLATEKFGKDIMVLWSPLDFSFVIRKFMRLINPTAYIVAETEIWPNIYRILKRRNVPIILINGRISDRAFKQYQKIPFFTKMILNCVKTFGMQSELDAQRIKDMGARSDSVSVIGNIKFDDKIETGDVSAQTFGLNDDDLVWVAGSTHPGEEEIIARVYNEVQSEFPQLKLIIAPRHPERSSDVVRTIQQNGLKSVKFSNLNGLIHDVVLVIDSIGHLRSLYSLASVVFVGKSLVGSGGQNIIEPAQFAKPIIVGPRMENFRAITKAFLDNSALIQVQNEEELKQNLLKLLRGELQDLGQKAKNVIEQNQGATQRTLELIKANV